MINKTPAGCVPETERKQETSAVFQSGNTWECLCSLTLSQHGGFIMPLGWRSAASSQLNMQLCGLQPKLSKEGKWRGSGMWKTEECEVQVYAWCGLWGDTCGKVQKEAKLRERMVTTSVGFHIIWNPTQVSKSFCEVEKIYSGLWGLWKQPGGKCCFFSHMLL